ncbi:hypothetical protein A9Q77_03900 [Marinomonas sp. 42_23_T18]|nr:hypothetical protein A9Q77_03900 [Marinomonas sp. 42_23_T18]
MKPLDNDNIYLEQTLNLSQQSVEEGNHPFGALLTINGSLVLEAKNTVNTQQDATCHAEMNLVREACKTLTVDERKVAVLYTSTEPCAMCAGAIYWAGIKHIMYACSGEKLNDIAGKSLTCHSEYVYKGAIEAPKVRQSDSAFIIEKAAAQHRDYWTQDWSNMT